MNRRRFLTSSAVALSSSTARLRGASTGDDAAKRTRIGISSWSFHQFFRTTREDDTKPLSGTPPSETIMDILDFPEMIADRYHVHNLEVVTPHFASTEPGYLQKFKTRMERAHSRLINIPVDYDELWEKPALSAINQPEREHAIALYKRWMPVARLLGAKSVRCDPGTVNPADPSLTIQSYQALAAEARANGIRVIVENHGNASRRPDVLVKILKASGAGALPDFGNFPDEDTRVHGLTVLFPLAIDVCHAKLNPAKFDFARCMRIARQSKYRGVFSIEAENGGNPYQEVQGIIDALLSNL